MSQRRNKGPQPSSADRSPTDTVQPRAYQGLQRPNMTKLRFATCLAAGLLTFQIGAEGARTYRLDGSNTHVILEIDVLGMPWLQARVRNLAGEFVLDASGRLRWLEVRMDAGSIDSGDDEWNTRLRSDAWFDVDRFPQIRYASTAIAVRTGRAMRVAGQLSLRGITRPVVLEVRELDCAGARPDGDFGACRFRAQGRVSRSEFHLPHGFWEGGDGVEITVQSTAPLEAASR